MKNVLKKVLTAIGIVILIIALFIAVFVIKAKLELKTMASIETKEIVDNIFSVQDSYTNLFLIKDSTQYIAIDGGNNLDVVSVELKKLNIDPNKIIAVLLTHTDKDHVAAIKLFKNAKIYLSKQEEQMINGKKPRFFYFLGNKIDTKEYSLIKDQQILNIGNIKIKGILTPGHTPGSMCYLINNKYLFTGDAISIKAGKIDKFNDLFNMDTETAIKSIEKIADISEAKYIFTAHYGFTNNYKNAIKGWGQ